MQHVPRRSGQVVRLETGQSIDDTVIRLERMLARTPWRLVARVDSKVGTASNAEPQHVLLVVPRGVPANGTQDLAWSLLLANEILVYREATGRVVVTYHEPSTEDAEDTAATESQLAAWYHCLNAAVALATGHAAPPSSYASRAPAEPTTQRAVGE